MKKFRIDPYVCSDDETCEIIYQVYKAVSMPPDDPGKWNSANVWWAPTGLTGCVKEELRLKAAVTLGAGPDDFEPDSSVSDVFGTMF